MKKINLLILITLSFIAITLTNCNNTAKQRNIISVSILPQKYFIDALTNEAIEVNVMIPPGSSHATYSPTSQQFKKLSDSKLYIGIGHLGYEQAWMPRLAELNNNMQIVILTEHIQLISDEHHNDIKSENSHNSAEYENEQKHKNDHDHVHGVDPHIWMSPKTVLEILPTIKSSLIKSFPELKDTIETNYIELYSKISEADKHMASVSKLFSKKEFLIFHPALTYLARDYGLVQTAVEQEGKEPSPAYLARIINKAKKESIPVIFIQEEYDIRNAQTVSHEAGIALVQINPMSYNWLEMMEKLTQTLEYYLNE